MGKFILTSILGLFMTTLSFGQTDSLLSQEEMEENDMVCFLTDANTITCFVAPEDMPEDMKANQKEVYSDQSRQENPFENVEPEPEARETPDNIQIQKEQRSEKAIEQNKKIGDEEKSYDKTKVKMI